MTDSQSSKRISVRRVEELWLGNVRIRVARKSDIDVGCLSLMELVPPSSHAHDVMRHSRRSRVSLFSQDSSSAWPAGLGGAGWVHLGKIKVHLYCFIYLPLLFAQCSKDDEHLVLGGVNGLQRLERARNLPQPSDPSRTVRRCFLCLLYRYM